MIISNSVILCLVCMHIGVYGPIFSRGLSHLCRKILRQRPKNCDSNLQNYYARLKICPTQVGCNPQPPLARTPMCVFAQLPQNHSLSLSFSERQSLPERNSAYQTARAVCLESRLWARQWASILTHYFLTPANSVIATTTIIIECALDIMITVVIFVLEL